MLSLQLYHAIIEEEKKGISEKNLVIAAKKVAATYNTQALKTGSTYLDYRKPQNRCAYLYKYAAIHTGLVTKFFRKLMNKKEVKNILYSKKDVKIGCLGGGPGTDVVGIFKALATFPCMHKKVSEATIYDVSVGWHNSYNYIIKNLINGKVKDIPKDFVKSNFEANFLEVNLLESIQQHVVKSIENKDIICMVKFVSAIMGNQESVKALKVLADLFKVGSVILFIDNYNKNLFNSMQTISQEVGLKIVMISEEERYKVDSLSKSKLFGCKPLKGTRVKVIGLVKIREGKLLPPLASKKKKKKKSAVSNKTDLLNSSQTSSLLLEEPHVKVASTCDKFTQTEIDNEYSSTKIKELESLINALSDLMSVAIRYNQFRET